MPTPPDLSRLQADLRSSSGVYKAAQTLASMAHNGNDAALTILLEAVASLKGWDRRSVVTALGQTGSSRAVGPLLDLLRQEQDAKMQQAIAESLGALADPSAILPLIRLLGSESAETRTMAASALTRFPAQLVTASMDSAQHSDDPLLRAAVIVKRGSTQPGEPLRAALRDPHAAVRRAAAEVLGLCNDRESIPAFVALLQDANESPSLHQAALASLMNLAASVEPDVMLALLGSAAPPARAWAAARLGAIQHSPAVEPLIALLRDPDQAVKEAAAEALGKLGDLHAAEPLGEAFADVGHVAIRALEMLGQKPRVQTLVAATQHPEHKVAVWAVEQLKEMGDVEALGAVLQSSGQSKHGLNMATAALSRLPDERVVQLLSDAMIQDENIAWAILTVLNQVSPSRLLDVVRVVLRCGSTKIKQKALVNLPTIEEAIDLLAFALNDPDPIVRREAIAVLSRRSEDRVLELLGTALADSDASVRKQAVDFLGIRKDARAVERIGTALADSEAVVRTAALEALRRRSEPQCVELIGKALTDSDEGVRKHAVTCLGSRREDGVVELFASATKDGSVNIRNLALSELIRRKGERVEQVLLEALRRLPEKETVQVLRYAPTDVRERLLEQLDEARIEAMMEELGGRDAARFHLKRGNVVRAIAELIALAEDNEEANEELTTILKARASECSEELLRKAVDLRPYRKTRYFNTSGDDPYGESESYGPQCFEIVQMAKAELARRGLKP